jgi:hypothetical protein
MKQSWILLLVGLAVLATLAECAPGWGRGRGGRRNGCGGCHGRGKRQVELDVSDQRYNDVLEDSYGG